MNELRFRQVHLDFHTSELIPGVGAQFDPDEFADTLAAAHVDSVTCFARCHHGMIYYDTRRHPERRHPSLRRNLLAEQIEACHARGIRVPIYTTVRWDHFTARQHPEWLVVDENGCRTGTKPFEAGFYNNLCLNTPFVDFLEEHTAEICEMLPVDGIFFDIVFPAACCCRRCIEGMLAEGMEPSDPAHRAAYADKVLAAFERRMFQVVKSRHPEATVFFNSGHVNPRHRPLIGNFTHLELESLPSGGWGYMHFPVAQRYARTLGVDTLGMTGKFHTTWGDFHSFKNRPALEFECLNMLALAAKCSIGDQLHPSGRICRHTYKLIGQVYERVKAAEPWCREAKPVVDIGLLTPEAFAASDHFSRLPAASIGAARVLQETRHQFDIIDPQADFAAYKVLVLPDEIPVDDSLAAKLMDYVAGGGAILASYRSGLAPDGHRFNLPALGVTLKGPAPYSPDFIVPGRLAAGLEDTGHVMYTQGLEVEPAADAEVLCPIIRPYFNRTYRHFCSHRHTPAEGPAAYPGVVRRGRCVYFMHPVFAIYEAKAPRWCKQLVANALDLLLPDPLVRATGPSTLLITLNHQPAHNRLVVHLLHYVPERRGREFDVVEDVIPLHDVKLSVRMDGEVRGVSLVPEERPIDFQQRAGRVEFAIGRLEGHELVAIGVK